MSRSIDRCHRCGGSIYFESHNVEDENGRLQWAGLEAKCLMCSRTMGHVSIQALLLVYGMAADDILRARFASLAFLSLRKPDA